MFPVPEGPPASGLGAAGGLGFGLRRIRCSATAHRRVSGGLGLRRPTPVSHAPSPVAPPPPNPLTVGRGPAPGHRNGIRIPATWARNSAYEPFALIDANNEAIPLDTGKTFIELVRQ